MSELTEIVRGGFDSEGSYLGKPEYILKLCGEAEGFEESIRILRNALTRQEENCLKHHWTRAAADSGEPPPEPGLKVMLTHAEVRAELRALGLHEGTAAFWRLANTDELLRVVGTACQVELRRLEDLLAAWVSLPRAGNQSMPAELRALYDAGMGVVAKRKAVWPGAGEAKEVERG